MTVSVPGPQRPLILLTGVALMRTLRRFAHRLDPAVVFVAPEPSARSNAPA